MLLKRRRFLTLASAACLAAPKAHAFRWQGTALGAKAQIILDHPRAADITRRARAEIDRLEDVFSLYRPGSALRRLNAAGRLVAPPFELLRCLAIARRVHRATDGRFDPTVQPLWNVLAEAHSRGRPAPQDALDTARRAIGFARVGFDSGAVVLSAGQALTLNGIAQGFIADQVARLMRAEGVSDVLIDTGEIVALGLPPDRDGWPVTIAGETEARLLRGRAMATSAPLGTVLDAAGTVGHIVDPRTGIAAAPPIRQITISAAEAALADALSTGLCLAQDRAEAISWLQEFADARLERLVG